MSRTDVCEVNQMKADGSTPVCLRYIADFCRAESIMLIAPGEQAPYLLGALGSGNRENSEQKKQRCITVYDSAADAVRQQGTMVDLVCIGGLSASQETRELRACLRFLLPYGVLMVDYAQKELLQTIEEQLMSEATLLLKTEQSAVWINAADIADPILDTMRRRLRGYASHPELYAQEKLKALPIWSFCKSICEGEEGKSAACALSGAYLAQTIHAKAVALIGDGGPLFDALAYSAYCNGAICNVFSGAEPMGGPAPETGGALLRYLLGAQGMGAYEGGISYENRPCFKAVSSLAISERKPEIAALHFRKGSYDDLESLILLYEYLNDNAFLLVEGDHEAAAAILEESGLSCIPVFGTERLQVLMKGFPNAENTGRAREIGLRLSNTYAWTCSDRLFELEARFDPVADSLVHGAGGVTVCVGVITYMHEAFIERCLRSVAEQIGDYHLHIVVCDDGSTDRTPEIIRAVAAEYPPSDRLSWELILREENIGINGNLKAMFEVFRRANSDFFTIIDGDDQYIDRHRIAKAIEKLIAHPQCTLFATSAYLEDVNKRTVAYTNKKCASYCANAEDIVKENFVGSSCVSFFCGRVMQQFDMSAFEQVPMVSDWFLDIFAARMGDIYYCPEPMSMYRVRTDSVWSGKPAKEKLMQMIDGIHAFNRYFNYAYEDLFEVGLIGLYAGSEMSKCSVAILDTAYPAVESGFRYREFSELLKAIPGSRVYTTGADVSMLKNTSVTDQVIKYKKSVSLDMAQRILRYLPPWTVVKADLLYGVFLNIAKQHLLPAAEKFGIPFVFTLYPGGGFCMNDEQSDQKLLEVMSSPYFRRVIVTQKIAYDYLLSKKFCRADQIEFIFGGMTVKQNMNRSIDHKKTYGNGKKTLDICFVAQKYTEFGREKGYDLFIDIARILSKKYSFIRFHAVGGWDARTLDVSGIDHLRFYGILKPEQLSQVYANADVIVSPNMRREDGSFDGFPTTCVADAMLHGVAAFVTDPYALNQGHFAVGEEIEILPHEAQAFVERIEAYIAQPERIRSLGRGGYEACNRLLSSETQVEPRVRLLTECIREEEAKKHRQCEPAQSVDSVRLSARLKRGVKMLLPPCVVSPSFETRKKLRQIYLNWMPEALKGLYRRVKSLLHIDGHIA